MSKYTAGLQNILNALHSAVLSGSKTIDAAITDAEDQAKNDGPQPVTGRLAEPGPMMCPAAADRTPGTPWPPAPGEAHGNDGRDAVPGVDRAGARRVAAGWSGATPWPDGASSCRTSSASPLLTMVPVAVLFYIAFTKWNVFRHTRDLGRHGQLRAALARHAVLDRAVEHRVLHGVPHPAHHGRGARPGPAAQPQAARGGVLPHRRVLPLHHLDRGPRPTCGTCCSARSTGRSTRSCGSSGSTTRPGGRSSADWSMPAVIIVGTWREMGYYMLLFLAGLQTIPTQLYEAARVDGASAWQRFWHVTAARAAPHDLPRRRDADHRHLQGLRPHPAAHRRAARASRRWCCRSTSTRRASRRTSSATRRPSRSCCSPSASPITIVQYRVNRRGNA